MRRNADYDWKEYVATDDGEFSGSEEEQKVSNLLLRQTTLDDAGTRKARIDALKKQAEEAQKMAKELEKAEADAQIKLAVRSRAADFIKFVNDEDIDEMEKKRLEECIDMKSLKDTIMSTVKENVLTAMSEILFKDDKPDYGDSKSADYFTHELGLTDEVYQQMLNAQVWDHSNLNIAESINTALANGNYRHRRSLSKSVQQHHDSYERKVNDLVGCFVMDQYGGVFQVCDGRASQGKFYISPTDLVDKDSHQYKLITLSKALENLSDSVKGVFFFL